MSVALNITIEQGADYTNTITVDGDTGAAKDLTGYTFAGQMRRSYRSTTSYALSVTSPTPTLGTILIKMLAADTALLPAGRYVYDVFMYSPDVPAIATRVIEGIVTVSPAVTR